MNYTFKIYKSIVDSIWYIIELNEKEYIILNNFTSSDWTPTKAQTIINGVANGKSKPKENAYEWANEDVYLVSNEHGVFLFDLIGERAGIEDLEKLGLRLTHEEFITFMQDFKKFIEENQ